jgi:hypothetical protein
MARFCTAAAFVIAAWWAAQQPSGQDPQNPGPQVQEPQPSRPPAAPAGAAPLPPVESEWVEPVPRRDLPGRFTPRDPIEGFWRLQRRSVEGRLADPGTGFLAVGRRYLMVQFQAPGTDPRVPLLRAASYAWRRTDDRDHVQMTVQVGHLNDTAGDIHVELAGRSEPRRFVLLGDRMRIERNEGDWLEFVRIE